MEVPAVLGISRLGVGAKSTRKFVSRFNPQTPIPPEISSVHGIYAKDLENEKPFEGSAERLYNFLKDAVIIAHNATFDRDFLVAEFARAGIDFKCKVHCTLTQAKRMLPGLPSYRLESLDMLLRLHGGKPHRALDDAITVTKLFLLLQTAEASGTPLLVPATYPLSKGLLPVNMGAVVQSGNLMPIFA
jgi:DNA polymerase-3 subunit epsilon